MTTAVLIRTLDDEVEALLTGETDECPVCGERVEVGDERVECQACGSVLERAPPRPGPGQLSLL